MVSGLMSLLITRLYSDSRTMPGYRSCLLYLSMTGRFDRDHDAHRECNVTQGQQTSTVVDVALAQPAACACGSCTRPMLWEAKAPSNALQPPEMVL
jgi:hypothetical protein